MIIENTQEPTRRSKYALKRKNPNAKVSFAKADNTEYKYIEHLDELGEELIQNTWWSLKETAETKAENERLASAIDEGMKDIDARGLETKTAEGYWALYKARSDAMNAVLDEQDRQRLKPTKGCQPDDEKLRKAYLEVSAVSSAVALSRGREDELAVSDYLNDIRTETEPKKATSTMDEHRGQRNRHCSFSLLSKKPLSERSLLSKGLSNQTITHKRSRSNLFMKNKTMFESKSTTVFLPGVGFTCECPRPAFSRSR